MKIASKPPTSPSTNPTPRDLRMLINLPNAGHNFPSDGANADALARVVLEALGVDEVRVRHARRARAGRRVLPYQHRIEYLRRLHVICAEFPPKREAERIPSF